jgi:hypothetical protein
MSPLRGFVSNYFYNYINTSLSGLKSRRDEINIETTVPHKGNPEGVILKYSDTIKQFEFF